MFMAPIIHVLQKRNEQVECSILAPPMYYVHQEWLGFSPETNKGIVSEILEVNEVPTFNFKPLQELGNAGIYTEKEIKSAQESLVFGLERTAVQNIITRRVTGLEANQQGLRTLDLFTKTELKNLAASVTHQIWGWMSDFGLFFSGFIGVYTIVKLIKYAIETIINGYTLYSTVGCGIRMTACLWNTLTHAIINRHRQKTNKTYQEGELDTIRIIDNETSVGQSKPITSEKIELDEIKKQTVKNNGVWRNRKE